MSKIKICGLFRDCDIDYVNEAKPDYIGFILNFPKSHRNISPERALELRSRLAEDIRPVGVFVNQPAEVVCEAAKRARLSVIQLHGQEDNNYIADLRKRISSTTPIWKAFGIRTASDLAAAQSSTADEILLDNGYGTGEVFDWSVISDFDRPFILAGGLTSGNIHEAIELFNPRVLDISSGVETDKVKDREKIFAAVRAVRGQ